MTPQPSPQGRLIVGATVAALLLAAITYGLYRLGRTPRAKPEVATAFDASDPARRTAPPPADAPAPKNLFDVDPGAPPAPATQLAPPPRQPDRVVPLLQLPPELTSPRRGPAARVARGTTTRPAGGAMRLSVSLEDVRKSLDKEPPLRAWYDQWLADRRNDVAISPERLEEVRRLLATNKIPAADLAKAAQMVRMREPPGSPVMLAWFAAAADRFEAEPPADATERAQTLALLKLGARLAGDDNLIRKVTSLREKP